MAININREVEDAFYRYKMPKLQAKVEGKGNGIKTVIVNVTDIATSLSRKPIYVTKYFGCELGAQVNVDEKNERYIVNGAHDATKLQTLLDGFIKKFVLCQSCGNPETVLSVRKKTEVKSKCKACGASSYLDGTHRLTQYITKNPPDEGDKKSKGKKGKTTEASDEEISDVAANNTFTNGNGEDDDDMDWGEDTTEEAQRERLNELTLMAKSLAMSSDVEKSRKERMHIFHITLTDAYKGGKLLEETEVIVREAQRLELGHKAILVLAEVLFDDPDMIMENLKKYAPVFIRMIIASDNSHKSQLDVLHSIILICKLHPALVKKAALMLKCMYDLDIVQEEIILEWSEKKPKKKDVLADVTAEVLSKCEVIFKWLKEAEEETDEEDTGEESDGEESEPEKVVKQDNKVNVEKDDDPEDDLDIDAI